MCPFCKSYHDNKHTINNIDVQNYYNAKNCLCEKHNELFIKYFKHVIKIFASNAKKNIRVIKIFVI